MYVMYTFLLYHIVYIYKLWKSMEYVLDVYK